MKDNKLQVIIQDSGLETTKARVLLENFKDYFDIADEWETKAKAIVVTNENQKPDMAMARIGRLFLREKRIAIEKTRKDLKEQSLREGKAIDGIANILKSLIVPIEEYLEKQERFIEIRDAEISEQKRIEGERLVMEKEEAERVAREKAEAAERERIHKENERLKAEAIERERLAKTERIKQEKLLAEQKAKADAERRILEQKANEERIKQAKILAEQKAEAEYERKILEEKNRQEHEKQAEIEKQKREKLLAENKAKQIMFEKKWRIERENNERLAKIEQVKQKKLQAEIKAQKAKNENEIECPFCHRVFKLGGENG